ncbi:MAG: molybdate ABC transporter substrate-binding protein [Woeseiaceae bacterium]|nr:molybdate ABC transporter substrate-binding protein [Woeseiaceae bacterium]
MHCPRPFLSLAVALFTAAVVSACDKDDDNVARVAVASNFAPTLREIGRAFEKDTGYALDLSSASTGKLYAQIVNGAPFDLFLAADVERPELLERAGRIVSGSRRTYATGRLVVWSGDARFVAQGCRAALEHAEARVAIANPRTAPYGAAAREALVALGLWERLLPRLAYGENVAQALQFAASGSAALAIVALAQLEQIDPEQTACRWSVPEAFYEPVRQQVVLLSRGADKPAAVALLDYLARPETQRIVTASGYGRGDVDD